MRQDNYLPKIRLDKNMVLSLDKEFTCTQVRFGSTLRNKKQMTTVDAT